MKTARRPQRSRVARHARRIRWPHLLLLPQLTKLTQLPLWPLCLAACAASIPTARAASCVDVRGADMLVSASEGCVAQMRQSAEVRRQVARQINSGVVQSASAARTALPSRPERSRTHGLDHPLARLSTLNSQSRYLWSSSQPQAPSYYGQTQAR